MIIQDGDHAVSDNGISGGTVGVAVVADIVNVVGTLNDNETSGTSVAPVQTFSYCGFTATAVVND